MIISLSINKFLLILCRYKELKKFQTEVIMINVSNSELAYADFKNKKDELLMTLQIMIEKMSYSERLENNIIDQRKNVEYGKKTLSL